MSTNIRILRLNRISEFYHVVWHMTKVPKIMIIYTASVFTLVMFLSCNGETQTNKIELVSDILTDPSPSTTEHYSSSFSTSGHTEIPSSTSTAESTSSTTRQTPMSSSSTVPPDPNDWVDLDQEESDKLVKFIVKEIQKLKVEHKELDDCQELDLSSVLSGKKQVGNPIKYSVTLKVQPQIKKKTSCQKQNDTLINMHPEICEADILEGDRGGTLGNGKTLIRSTCLQVEELQD